MLDLKIIGGLVVRPMGEPAVESIGIKDGRIAALGNLTELPAKREVDLAGAYVLPGIIDTHVHLGMSDPEREFSTETEAAALGGVTTMLVYFRSMRDYDQILPDFLDKGRQLSYVDFAVHLGILHDEHLAKSDHYLDAFGIKSIKMYTTYKKGELVDAIGQNDGFILDVLFKLANRADVVANVHCENDDIVERRMSAWTNDGRPSMSQWQLVRPPIAEVEAIRRVCLLAREAGCRIFIPHVSSAAGADAALAERDQGTRLTLETCPHYLMPNELVGAGTLAKVNPPVRSETDSKALWAHLRTGRIDVVGTDHCVIPMTAKATDILHARPGFPGLGTLLPVLLTGVNRGDISLQAIARCQLNAARTFGLDGKGLISPGYDADLVAVDLGIRRSVERARLRGLAEFTPYEGIELKGWPVLTIRRGEILANDGELESSGGGGRYIRRDGAS